ncbi:hypothetical protein [Micromonospora sp. NPDC050276]|uniref:hypothetical protein n=1 Tax=Micromonospora sp. NPDC050276 TaxID=3364278 RepID=UPI0037AAA97A
MEFGLRWLDSIGVDLVHARVGLLTEWLLERLTALRYDTGGPLVQVYGYLAALHLPTGGAVRVSFGLASTATDAERFAAFAQSTYLSRDVGAESPLPPRLRC